MPYNQLTDIDPVAKYQTTLKTAIASAKAKVLPVVLYHQFPFKEGPFPLLVVGPLASALAKQIHDKGAHKIGEGKCLYAANGEMLVKGNGLTKPFVENALKAGKTPLTVRILAGADDLERTAQTLQVGQGKASATDAAKSMQANARATADPDYQKVIQEIDTVLKKVGDSADQAKVTAWKAEILKEYKEEDWVQVKALAANRTKDLEGVKARMVEREKQFVTKQAAVQGKSDQANATAGPQDQQKLTVAWGQVKQDADADRYTAATAKLEGLEKLIPEVLGRTAKAKRDALVDLKEEAAGNLPTPTATETDALAKAESAVETQIQKGDYAAANTALDLFEKEMGRLVKNRADRAQALALADKANQLWEDKQRIVSDKVINKIKGSLKNAQTHIDAGKWRDAIKSATAAMNDIVEDLRSRADQQAAFAQANAALKAAANQSENEDNAALSYGDGKFPSGLLNSIWKAAKAVRSVNPPWGSVNGPHDLGSVEAAIATWRSTGASGIITNFHVPGGRPQAKWEKDFTRPSVEANFCCKWRGNKINIHVDIDVKSYFDKYTNEVDWTLVPKSVRDVLKH
jgi:hypothetical protein